MHGVDWHQVEPKRGGLPLGGHQEDCFDESGRFVIELAPSGH